MLKTVSSITNAIGALNYKGTWNASTNSPALASGVGTKGDYYVVSVAGSTSLDGETLWGVGDWAVFNGAAWQKVEGGNTINATTVTASTSVTTPIVQATNSGGLALKNSGGTTQLSVGAGGGDNVTISVATNITPANAAVAISPTGTGTVAISPAGALTINPTAASTINNASIGATTALAGRFTDVTATTGNVVIGTTAKGITTGSAIPLGFGVNGSTTQVSLNTSGDLLVGTGFSIVQDINSQLRGRITGTGPSYGFFEYYYGAFRSGYLIWDNTSLSLVNLSDYRIKENVVDLTSALDRLQQLKPRKFNFISDPSKTVDGFVAHELGEVIPQAVFGEKDAVDESGNPVYQAIDQSKIIPLLVASIQELKAEFDAYKASHP
jgi:hypothetical protein